MVERKVLACDLCETIPAIRVTIEDGDYRGRVDLCEEHQRPIRELIDKARVLDSSGTLSFSRVKNDLDL